MGLTFLDLKKKLRCATTPQKSGFFRAEVGGEVITVGHWDCYHLSNKQLTKDVFCLGAFFLGAFLVEAAWGRNDPQDHG